MAVWSIVITSNNFHGTNNTLVKSFFINATTQTQRPQAKSVMFTAYGPAWMLTLERALADDSAQQRHIIAVVRALITA